MNKTIVIDFPWKVKNKLRDTRYYRCRDQNMPYKQMTDKEIYQFPIEDFADSQCDLFIWGITSRLPFIFKLVEHWNNIQEYKKLHWKYMDFLAWDKELGVPVNGIYRQVEWIVYFYRGKMGINKSGKFIPSMFRERRSLHSRKPKSFYKRLKTNTQKPRIDIFARQRHEGFDAYGDQIHPIKQEI